jgi:DNA-binding IclR family transcriptional regulator
MSKPVINAPSAPNRACQTPSVPAVDRVLSMLELIAQTRRGISLSELCRRLQLPKSSSHCLILTLERRGYVLRSAVTKRYVFGEKLFRLGESVLKGVDLREKAAPTLHALMKQTGLTVHLAIPDHGKAVVIDKIAPPDGFHVATWVGKTFDLHCSGVGKALLAHLSEEDFLTVVHHYGLARYNENTITSVKRLAAEIECIQHQGYAFEDEEGELGFRCIGAPIFDPSGVVVAAVSVAGSTSQITADNISARCKQVVEATRQISLLLKKFQPDTVATVG